jgi:hypothetical protein
MSQENNPPPASEATSTEKQEQEALEKYKELYQYSTDVLLKEHERFNRADEKASKYATMFFFLIGAVAYYDKWIFDRLHWPHNCLIVLLDFPLIALGLLALVLAFAGLIIAHHAMTVRPVVSRPLNQEVLDFFENETRITIYYGLARENSNAYAKNRNATDAKYALLKRSYYIMISVFALLTILSLIYIACVFIDKVQTLF